jgi:5-methylcytosine-specific restriction protein A
MPSVPKRPCTYPGCGALVSATRCDKHRSVGAKQYDKQRGSSAQRGYGYRWQKASAAFLLAHPLCQCAECREGQLRVRPSQVTDHKIPHRGDMRLFWDSTNWQAMSKDCHDKKTASEDGGFGNAAPVASGKASAGGVFK